MPEPKNLAELLARIHRERERLAAQLARVPTEQMTTPVLAGGWSVKDVLAHIVFWEQRALLIVRNAQAGATTPLSWQPGEDADMAINRVNEEARRASAAQTLSEVQACFAASYQEVLATLGATPEQYLFGSEEFTRITGGNAIELIAGNTYEHYDEHIAMIAAWLDA